MPSSTLTAEAYPIAGLSRKDSTPVSGSVTVIDVGRETPSVPTTNRGELTPPTTSNVSP